jgi:hypothetical protein
MPGNGKQPEKTTKMTTAGSDREQELADKVHEALCIEALAMTRCSRYTPESAHHDFYQLRAQNLMTGLEPLIGAANVLSVVRIVTDELL